MIEERRLIYKNRKVDVRRASRLLRTVKRRDVIRVTIQSDWEGCHQYLSVSRCSL